MTKEIDLKEEQNRNSKYIKRQEVNLVIAAWFLAS